MDLNFLYQNRKQSEILFLGSHHWKVFGLDQVNPDPGDMFTLQRKKELEELLQILSKFKPTKVMIESNQANNETMNERYAKFRSDQLDLNQDEYVREGYQIGFRLAKRMDLDEIYCIDNRNPEVTDLDFDAITKTMEAENLTDYSRIMETYIQEAQIMLDDVLKQPLKGIYLDLNSHDLLYKNQLLYYLLAEVGKGWDASGLEMASLWYKRNMGIFAHIAHLTDFTQEERIFVVYGQGHVPYLQYNAEISPYYKLRHFKEFI